MNLTLHQAAAERTLLEAASTSRIISLSGPAGSGKTTLLKSLVPKLRELYRDVVVVTPTNKAAKVLNDKGLPAGTVHSTFFVPLPDVKPVKFVSSVDWVAQGNPLPESKRDWAEVVVVDEASMLPTWILNKLRDMAGLIVLVGDPFQLPPVNDRINPEGFFNTMRHTATLSEILRQAEGSDILSMATKIRTGQEFERGLKAFAPELSFSEMVAEMPQFIAYTNKERAKINRLVRRCLGHLSALPADGEKMICASNYSDVLLNGTECKLVSMEWNGKAPRAKVLLEVDMGGGQVVVEEAMIGMHAFMRDLQPQQQEGFTQFYGDWLRYEEKYGEKDEPLALRYGYCITAHASQGSEYPSVVVIDQVGTLRYVADQNRDSGMSPDQFVRRWMYTAVTRPREELVFAPTWWVANGMAEVAA